MVLCGLIAKRQYRGTHKHEKSILRQTAEKWYSKSLGKVILDIMEKWYHIHY